MFSTRSTLRNRPLLSLRICWKKIINIVPKCSPPPPRWKSFGQGNKGILPIQPNGRGHQKQMYKSAGNLCFLHYVCRSIVVSTSDFLLRQSLVQSRHLRHSGIWGVADEAVSNKVLKEIKNTLYYFIFCIASKFTILLFVDYWYQHCDTVSENL
jgi:hypothetical protein